MQNTECGIRNYAAENHPRGADEVRRRNLSRKEHNVRKETIDERFAAEASKNL